MKLNDWLQRNLDYYLTQDMYCNTCRMVKTDYLGKICECGGQFVKSKMSVQLPFEIEMKRGFANFKQLAQHAKLSLLEVNFLFC